MERKVRGLPTNYYAGRDPDVQLLRRADRSTIGGSAPRNAVPTAVLGTFEGTARGQTPAGREALGAYFPTLRVRFLGHFELLRDDELVALGRNRKTLAILKYLLANRSRLVSQDQLMGWLWP